MNWIRNEVGWILLVDNSSSFASRSPCCASALSPTSAYFVTLPCARSLFRDRILTRSPAISGTTRGTPNCIGLPSERSADPSDRAKKAAGSFEVPELSKIIVVTDVRIRGDSPLPGSCVRSVTRLGSSPGDTAWSVEATLPAEIRKAFGKAAGRSQKCTGAQQRGFEPRRIGCRVANISFALCLPPRVDVLAASLPRPSASSELYRAPVPPSLVACKCSIQATAADTASFLRHRAMQRERAPPRPEHQLNPLTTQSLGLGLKRSSGIVELAALDSDSPTSTAPTSTSPSPPSSTAPSSTGFEITSRLKAYRPPASLPASPPTPITPLPQGSLSHNPSGSSSFRSRRSSPPAPFRISADAVASTSSHNPEAKTTHTLSSSVDDRGRRMVNQYVRLKTIGQGSHGKVWLCAEPNPAREDDERETSNSHEERGLEHDDDDLVYSAIKSVAREGGRGKSLRHAKGKKAAGTGGIGSDDQVKREVAIMKRLDHKNVVRLKEVIDDVKSKKVFMGPSLSTHGHPADPH